MKRLTLFLAVASILAAGFVIAGPLSPPGGPVSSTYKTLAEIEPRTPISSATTPGDAASVYRITLPGSYYLTTGFAGVSGKSGIVIASSDVTLDLNGFELIGVPGSLDGIAAAPMSLQNIAVRNGSLRGWGRDGVNLFGLSAVALTISDIIASGNTRMGIAAGYSSTVLRCVAYGNGAQGIAGQDGVTVGDCTVEANTGGGLILGRGCTVARCSAVANGDIGINIGDDGCVITSCAVRENRGAGILTGDDATISNCSVSASSGDDINIASRCLVTANTCSSAGFLGNDGAGIHAIGSDNRIEANNCTGSTRGIDVDTAGNIIIRNTCSSNTLNWSIVAFNSVGPIVAASWNGAAINGNTYAGSLGSTDPNANFTY